MELPVIYEDFKPSIEVEAMIIIVNENERGEKMNLERIKKDLNHQTRNGRKNIYIKVDDLNELVQGAKQEVRGEDRIYIGIEAMKKIVEAYEKNTIEENEKAVNDFKERLKVDMPDYKLTRIDEYGFKFEPIKEERD